MRLAPDVEPLPHQALGPRQLQKPQEEEHQGEGEEEGQVSCQAINKGPETESQGVESCGQAQAPCSSCCCRRRRRHPSLFPLVRETSHAAGRQANLQPMAG